MVKEKYSEGQYRVGISFNPGNNSRVAEIKELASELIDLIDCYGRDDRCTALAMTAFEEGAMWAVKSVTKPER